MNNKIKEHRKYLERCLNSRSVDAKMVATMTLNESRKNSKGVRVDLIQMVVIELIKNFKKIKSP